MCVSALVADLIGAVPEVILNVNSGNAPAIRVYEQVGFRHHCTYREGRAVVLGATGAAQPSTARRRSRRAGART
jgi:hypothetical protein